MLICVISDDYKTKFTEMEEKANKSAERSVETNKRLANIKQDYEEKIATVGGKIYQKLPNC